MRILKPQYLSVLQQSFEREQRAYLGVAVIAFAPLAAPPALIAEQDLWQFLPPLLDPEVPLDVALPKTGGEFVVVGRVHAPGGELASGIEVEARVGALHKVLHAYGAREWQDGRPGPAAPLTELQCDWAAAYGGAGFAENPRGRGAAPIETPAGRSWPLPHLEYPTAPSERPDRPIPPACFAPIPMTWPARRRFDGTYDDAWLKNEYPGPPRDLDWRLHCIAPADQWQPRPFEGTEPVELGHWHPEHSWIEGTLPGIRPVVAIRDRGRTTAEARFGEPRLTTVWLFPNELRMVLVWHTVFPVEDELADSVELVLVGAEWLDRPRARQHYLDAIDARLDAEHGALKMLADEELLPEGLATANESLARYQELLADSGVAVERAGERVAKAAAERQVRLTEALGAQAAAKVEADAAAVLGRLGMPPLSATPPTDPAGLQRLAAEMGRTMPSADVFRQRAEGELAAVHTTMRRQLADAGHQPAAIEALLHPAPAVAKPPSPTQLVAQFEQTLAGLPRASAATVPVLDPRLRAVAAEAEALRAGASSSANHLDPPPPPREPALLARWRDGATAARAQGRSFAGLKLKRADFSGMDLAGVDFSEAELDGASFKGALLRAANFRKASLAHAVLDGAVLDEANFEGANLGHASLSGASARACRLTGAVLQHTLLSGAVLDGAVAADATFLDVRADRAHWAKAELDGAQFLRCRLPEAVFAGARLARALFLEADLSAADFTDAALESATFVTCKLDAAQFDRCSGRNARFVHGSTLRGASFAGASVPQANFRALPLDGANFAGACLDGADLSGAECADGVFQRASLKGALLMKGQFQRAAFTGANLMQAVAQHADLSATDLRGANLYAADLMRVTTDAQTSAEGAFLAKARTQPQRRARGPGAAGDKP
jgi:uncharacterized protein YjbI with pentapeptide repeats